MVNRVCRYFLDTEFIERPGLLDLISIGIVCEDGRSYYAVSTEFDESKACQWVRDNVIAKLPPRETWKPRAQIGAEIRAFVTGSPQFFGYFADYDWVLFCWLQGRMIDLPKGWPQFCLDLVQSMVMRGISKAALPKQDEATAHDALADARWTYEAWKFVHPELTR